jgi:uncharacterized protein YnzC (UPF0291/DUF896 family)
MSLISCTRGPDLSGDPKQRLIEYISKSFALKQVDDRSQLLAYLTGDVKQRLESWSVDQFREAFLNSKRSLVKISVKEVKMVSDGEAQVTYEIIYNEQKKSTDGHLSEAKITNKKLCQMTKGEHGYWMIADVRNIKEFIEFKDEFSLP